jgi:ribosome biogenesis protein Tsr3
MKKILTLILILSLVSAMSMFLNILALNDIYHDYISKKVFALENIIPNETKLPEWTNCKGEWDIVRIDFMIRIIAMIITVLVIVILLKRKNKS